MRALSKIVIIAHNTYREIMRDRILFGIVIFALLLIGFSLAIGQLSFAEQARITLNFGLVGIQLTSVVIAIFAGSQLVSKEIEKQTILTILSRPVSRDEFLLGKYLGLNLVIITIVVGLSLVLAMVGIYLDIPMGVNLVYVLIGICLEASVLLAITLLFGVITKPFLTVACSVGVFLIGHWVSSLIYFSERSGDSSFRALGKFVSYGFPNLERFNFRSWAVYQDSIESAQLLNPILHAIAWLILLYVITSLIFRRKDFV